MCCSSAEAELGQGLASGEAPAATAAVLAILRVGVIEQLGEGGQVRFWVTVTFHALQAPLYV